MFFIDYPKKLLFFKLKRTQFFRRDRTLKKMLHDIAVVFAIHMLFEFFFSSLLYVMVFKKSSESFCMKGIGVAYNPVHIKNCRVFCHLANIQ
ncbi:hypothetical protein D3C81_991820 [compost metagenome]